MDPEKLTIKIRELMRWMIMFETAEIFTAVAIMLFVLVSVCTIILLRGELLRLRILIRCERADRQSLENDIAALLACSKTIGERVRSQDLRQNRMSEKLKVLDSHGKPEDVQLYDQVHRMIGQGMPVEQIANICNLRRGEVELLNHVAVHRTAA
ncbi:MAG: energy-converting hydrogenase Eha subunit C [Gammaproteobacteria bacterium]|jgi:energy-converting hydrogenase Eha subunit C